MASGVRVLSYIVPYVPPAYTPPSDDWFYFLLTRDGVALPSSGTTMTLDWTVEGEINDTDDITYDKNTGLWTVSNAGTYQIDVQFLIRSGSGSGSGWGLPNVVNCTIGVNGAYPQYPAGEAASSDGPVNVKVFRTLAANDTIQMKCNYNLSNPFIKSGWWTGGGTAPNVENYVSWIRIRRIA